MRRSFYVIIGLFICTLGIVSIFVLLNNHGMKNNDKQKVSHSFEVIDEAFQIIVKEGVHPVKEGALIEGALRGMTDVIGDPYSTYLSKEEAIAHKESLASERVGIGAEITRSNGKFLIVSPLKGSPAAKAGLQPYDEIIRLNGENIGNFSLQELIEKMRGKEGTTLQLTVYRPQLKKHLEITIVREKIALQTVTSEVIEVKGRKLGYISIRSFSEETDKEWEVATNAVLGNGAEALIIDVRGNPGGYLYSVSEIVSSLLEEEVIFAFMEDRTGSLIPLIAEQSSTGNYNKKLKTIRLALLQDEGSASASEVLSAALQDEQRATIIGTNSFGKGTVQDTFHLSNGGEVKLSTHKWLTPKERWIHGEGVSPNIEVQANPIFNEHTRLITERYERGNFHDDIAYAQRILASLGYRPLRDDGYFDHSTVSAIMKFRKKLKLEANDLMDQQFFNALKEEVDAFRLQKENDDSLQMALDYLVHQLN